MGVLTGMKIVEIAGLGPGPFCGMLLADLGADVITVERPRAASDRLRATEIFNRGKRSVTLDLKKPGAVEIVLQILEQSDALIEGMRPGKMERLGLGPEVCLARKPSLIYGRMTGWGQDGPLAQVPGHDGNFAALSGALWMFAPPGQPPAVPPAVVGDVAGGALYLALGILAGTLSARQDGRGQIVDAAMIDGSAHMLNLVFSIIAGRSWKFDQAQAGADPRHWVRSYRCSDGEWIFLGPDEPQFYAQLGNLLGLGDHQRFMRGQWDASAWPALTEELSALFATRTRAEWCDILEGTDTCFTPVLSPSAAASHAHMAHRNIYQSIDGVLQAAPAPRFSATPSAQSPSVPARGAHTYEVLGALGLTATRIAELEDSGALGTTESHEPALNSIPSS